MNEFHKTIKNLRIKSGLTQQQVADKLFLVVSAYSKIERGETELTIRRMLDLSIIFNVPYTDILSGKGKDGKGKDGIGKDGIGKDGIGKDGIGKDGIGIDGIGKDGIGKDMFRGLEVLIHAKEFSNFLRLRKPPFSFSILDSIPFMVLNQNEITFVLNQMENRAGKE